MWHYLSYDVAFWISIAAVAVVFVGGGIALLQGRRKQTLHGRPAANRMEVAPGTGLRGLRLRLLNLQVESGTVVLQMVNIGGPAQRPKVACEAAEGVRADSSGAWHAGGRVCLTFGFLSTPGPFRFELSYQDQLGAHHAQTYEVRSSERTLELIAEAHQTTP